MAGPIGTASSGIVHSTPELERSTFEESFAMSLKFAHDS
jgi:hypothetical protein